ncbi:hypothetical protein C882_2296 [Caenispirillum salinarum AK4]|uniref:Transposase n=1 Tax=Caenispirillum salinarum AK4 TaxID=1238182 RepID=K9GPI0_9PROT|nr:transposase [Caenispirillum salinarum]EKV26584.1 hypothetical protein C882_2296 [Caenispirillum salinarum AK4]
MEEKVRILAEVGGAGATVADVLAEVGGAGATVADVARRHDISRHNIYQWRREARRQGVLPDDAPRFLAVEMAQDKEDGGASGDVRVEIGLGNGRILRVLGNALDDVVARMIRITEAA